jgi:dTDP-4-dehydrorhamnose 3,5-epimerase-like enzyme
MHRDSAKGFHIHPPYLPDGADPSAWFHGLYVDYPDDYSRRPYGLEQWDVMFFLTGICEMILVDERDGMPRRVMRLIVSGDTRCGPDTGGVVIPPGVGHAIRSVGTEDLIMVYGTSTSFNPQWEGRIASRVERASLPDDWIDHLEWGI